MKLSGFLLIISASIIFHFANAQQTEMLNSYEKILYNAKIFTANIDNPYAEAVDGRQMAIFTMA
jgi:hypothetical protein